MSHDERDRAVLEQVQAWVEERVPGSVTEVSPDGHLVWRRDSPQSGEGVPVVVVRARAGRLVRVDVMDPALRPVVDGMVKAFDEKGLWSFNGVVRTRGPE